MKKRDPFQHALAALMASAADGRFAWGEPLVVTALAQELGLSPTPVREALARLSGEGLIDHRPGRGYFASSPSVEDVVDLLEYHRRLVHWALDLIEQATIRPPIGPIDGASGERVFVAIVRASERSVVVRGHWRTTLQLRPIRKLQVRMSASDAEWIRRVPALAPRLRYFGDPARSGSPSPGQHARSVGRGQRDEARSGKYSTNIV